MPPYPLIPKQEKKGKAAPRSPYIHVLLGVYCQHPATREPRIRGHSTPQSRAVVKTLAFHVGATGRERGLKKHQQVVAAWPSLIYYTVYNMYCTSHILCCILYLVLCILDTARWTKTPIEYGKWGTSWGPGLLLRLSSTPEWGASNNQGP